MNPNAKRWLISVGVILTPLFACTFIAVLLGHVEPTAPNPDYGYPYRSEWYLAYLSSNWVVIGIVGSIGLLIMGIIEFVVERIGKWHEKKTRRL